MIKNLLTYTIVGASLLLTTQVNAEAMSASQKLSYTIGYEMGKSFKDQNIKIDQSSLMQGLKDGVQGDKPQIDEAQRKKALKDLQDSIITRQEHQFRSVAKENQQKGKLFLAKNAKQPGVKTLPDGLQYKILKKGTGPKPNLNDTVTVNYAGEFLDGKVFDSSYKRGKPTTFALDEVITGWQKALTMMPVGSVWEVYIPAKLAYGKQGLGTVIGPNQTLKFKIQLLSISKN